MAIPEQDILLVDTQTSSMPDGDIVDKLRSDPKVLFVQPQYLYRTQLFIPKNVLSNLISSIALPQPVLDGTMKETAKDNAKTSKPAKPEVKLPTPQKTGNDLLIDSDADLDLANAKQGWEITRGNKNITVAVIDSGVDYNHEDLITNMWRDPDNSKIVGWDFVDNDDRPFDVTQGIDAKTFDGNPGHGTHCAGNVGAAGNNALGTSGISPDVSIMALRMLNEKGAGKTLYGVRSIDFAIKHGAQIISASWGSEGENGADEILKDAIKRAADKGILFVNAAGNVDPEQQAKADNDNNPEMREYPASFDLPNIISVASSDRQGHLADYSHWGAKMVHLAAPGSKSFSTVPMNRSKTDYPGTSGYEDSFAFAIIEKGKQQLYSADWDGTSMATPQVAGAAALLYALHSGDSSWNFERVKKQLMLTTRPEKTLEGKVASGGVLDVYNALSTTIYE